MFELHSVVQRNTFFQSTTPQVDPVDETLAVVERVGRVFDRLVVDDRLEQYAQSNARLQLAGHQVDESASAAATVSFAVEHRPLARTQPHVHELRVRSQRHGQFVVVHG